MPPPQGLKRKRNMREILIEDKLIPEEQLKAAEETAKKESKHIQVVLLEQNYRSTQLILEAVDELLLIQRGRELGLALGDEQFKSILDNIKVFLSIYSNTKISIKPIWRKISIKINKQININNLIVECILIKNYWNISNNISRIKNTTSFWWSERHKKN